MEDIELKKIIETLLFITDLPLQASRIAQIAETDEEKAMKIINEIRQEYNEKSMTLHIMEVAGGFQMATRPEYSLWVRKLFHNKMTVRLSSAAMETLSIIAYKQPITRAEIEIIRGVEVIGPLETLIERRLVTIMGRKETVGRPLLYGTTNEFLRQFGLKSLDELPSIDSIIIKKEEPMQDTQNNEQIISSNNEEITKESR
jgi:segregation and condensation protein B